MRTEYKFVIGMIVIFILFMLTNKLFATEYKLLELDKTSMEYRHHRNYRDAFFPKYETIEGECVNTSECFKYGASVLFDLNLLRIGDYRLFWRNDVNMDATNKQVRHVGWKWEMGFPIVPEKLEVFTRHYSRHILDSDPMIEQRYPLRDEYVVRMNFYERKK